MSPKLIVVGAFMIIGGLGALIINFGLNYVEDAILVVAGGVAIYIGAKVA